jgi:hypothetical protein
VKFSIVFSTASKFSIDVSTLLNFSIASSFPLCCIFYYWFVSYANFSIVVSTAPKFSTASKFSIVVATVPNFFIAPIFLIALNFLVLICLMCKVSCCYLFLCTVKSNYSHSLRREAITIYCCTPEIDIYQHHENSSK